MVLQLPSVLSLSIDKNLMPKLDWLQTELGLSDAALRESILATPVRLGVSLENRYRPRLRACRKAQADERKVLTLASWPDDRFCASIGVSVDDLAACRAVESGR